MPGDSDNNPLNNSVSSDEGLSFLLNILSQIENLNLDLKREFIAEVALIFGKNFAEKIAK